MIGVWQVWGGRQCCSLCHLIFCASLKFFLFTEMCPCSVDSASSGHWSRPAGQSLRPAPVWWLSRTRSSLSSSECDLGFGMTGHLSSCMWNLRFWGTMHRGVSAPSCGKPSCPSPSAGDLRELPRVPLRGEGSCGGGGAPRDSACTAGRFFTAEPPGHPKPVERGSSHS